MAEPDYRNSLHRTVAETAHAMIAGTLSPIEASRVFVGLAAELGTLEDEDFQFFLDLDSETDHFPLGTMRERWSEEALAREDAARIEYEAKVREEALSRCSNLIAKYSP